MSDLIDRSWSPADLLEGPPLDTLTALWSRLAEQLPVDDPLLIFSIAIIIFLTAPLLLQSLKLPGIIGIILMGVLIGPHAANILEHDATIELLGQVGLVYLMFLVGIEINLNQFLENKDHSIVFGILSFAIPQAVGTLFGVYVLGLPLMAALLFAAIFSSHTPLAYPVISRLNIAKNQAITTTMGGTILTDTLALLTLTVAVASLRDELDWLFWTELTVGLTVFFFSVWIIVSRLSHWLFSRLTEESYFEFLFVLSVLFVCAYLAELAGVEPIIGAFLAGLVLNRLVSQNPALYSRIEFVGNTLFIPFFLLSVGMLMDITVLAEDIGTFIVGGSLIGMLVVTKFVAAWITGKIYHYNGAQIFSMFGISIGQAAAALAIVIIGFNKGLFDQNIVNGVVVMIMVVSLISPAIVEKYGQNLALAEKEFESKSMPQRILIPLPAEGRHKEGLLELATLIRTDDFEGPLRTLTVIRPDSNHPETRSESFQENAVDSNTAIEHQPRVDHDVAAGIVQAVFEHKVSTILIGWDGTRSYTYSVLGGIADELLRRTDQMVVASLIKQPLKTTKRVVVIFPANSHQNPGFYEAVHSLKRLSKQIDAPVTGLVIEGNPEKQELIFQLIKPEIPCRFARVAHWKQLTATLLYDYEISEDDLVVLMSARRGKPGWHPALQILPKSLAKLVPGNLLIYYPANQRRLDDKKFLKSKQT